MGYRHKPRRIEITFDEPHDYAGFEAVLRGKNLAGFLALFGIGDVDLSAVDDQLREMAGSLISWNLETEDGTPVPATPEAVFEQDQDLMVALAAAWLDGVKGGVKGGVSGPLETTSTGGEPSLVESLPMEPPSESLAS